MFPLHFWNSWYRCVKGLKSHNLMLKKIQPYMYWMEKKNKILQLWAIRAILNKIYKLYLLQALIFYVGSNQTVLQYFPVFLSVKSEAAQNFFCLRHISKTEREEKMPFKIARCVLIFISQEMCTRKLASIYSQSNNLTVKMRCTLYNTSLPEDASNIKEYRIVLLHLWPHVTSVLSNYLSFSRDQ